MKWDCTWDGGIWQGWVGWGRGTFSPEQEAQTLLSGESPLQVVMCRNAGAGRGEGGGGRAGV